MLPIVVRLWVLGISIEQNMSVCQSYYDRAIEEYQHTYRITEMLGDNLMLAYVCDDLLEVMLKQVLPSDDKKIRKYLETAARIVAGTPPMRSLLKQLVDKCIQFTEGYGIHEQVCARQNAQFYYQKAKDLNLRLPQIGIEATDADAMLDKLRQEFLFLAPPDLSSLSERQMLAYNYAAKNNGSINREKYQELIGKSENTARRDLNQMIKLGIFRKPKPGPSAVYTLRPV